MSRLDPSVAKVRLAVRAVLPHGEPGLVLVACSGGADSLALASATAFVAPRQGWRAGLVTIDHQLQAGSTERAKTLVDWADGQGFTPAESIAVEVGKAGGPEAAARDARYEALAASAQHHKAKLILLGHTEDDQAETVLLALARGAGPRGLSGMPVSTTKSGARFVRPLLTVSRRTCREACAAEGLTPWDDPHNADHSYARARVRKDVMPALVEALGEDVVPNLARSAALIAADNTYLDETALGFQVDGELAALPGPIRTRVLHRWALSLGVPGAALSHHHIEALDALITNWHGQGPVMLPGGISVSRVGGLLRHAQRSA